jgi:deoxyribodipyrimidine photo-lyase
MFDERPINVVWLKRDLRLADHAPLREACARGDVLVVYVVEPELLAAPERDPAHIHFAAESLAELRDGLRALGSELVILRGDLPGTFDALRRWRPISGLFSHQETGDGATYARDRRVKAWCRQWGIPWHESVQTGVVRGLRSRDGWSSRWNQTMAAPLLEAPERIPATPLDGLSPSAIPTTLELGLPPSTKTDAQKGGEAAARATLRSFFGTRGQSYADGLSSPVSAGDACSRLSPYLAFGNLSMRQVVRALERRQRDAAADRSPRGAAWRRSLEAFGGRLRWHCHFMQKLEDEPRLEFENLSRACDGLRESEFRPERFEAWARGETGFPMVDACMRALLATGWINFRMRAMLMSFASYDLWLHWRQPGLHLARHFLDYEAGIHWPQVQMQSGTTGINTLRMYSPTKQLADHDPTGVFVRQWLPALRHVDDRYLAEPWRMPLELQQRAGCVIGRDYPFPIVNHAEAIAHAKRRLAEVRQPAEARNEAQQILFKHGSRLPPEKRRG